MFFSRYYSSSSSIIFILFCGWALGASTFGSEVFVKIEDIAFERADWLPDLKFWLISFAAVSSCVT